MGGRTGAVSGVNTLLFYKILKALFQEMHIMEDKLVALRQIITK